jgi:CO/xanthine dehydrogenase Mo-binding subunit
VEEGMNVVGQSVIRADAVEKVKGAASYPGDINLPDQVYLKLLFSSRVHAIVRKVDAARARALPGVLAVLTAADVPVNEYGLGTKDQPVLCGPGSAKQYADHVRCLGDQVALVIAESEEIAARTLPLIDVEYEDLPVVTDMHLAMQPDAPVLHPERDGNVFTHYRIRKGNMDDGFKHADVIVEGIYHTPAQEHAYLQPEAGLGYIDDEGRVTVVVAGQWTHEDREQVAHALNLPEDRVRIIYPAIGGAFGGREDMSVQIILGLAAKYLHEHGIHRPVKIIWNREESIMGHHKRHPFSLKARWGATREGKIVAAEVEMIADGGAYIYTSPKVLGNATLLCTGPYEIPNVKVDAYAVYTTNLPNGAFRGFGGPQGAFEAECQMNKLAEKLGMDPVELRLRNVLRDGSVLSMGTVIPGHVSMPEVVEAAASASGWLSVDHHWTRSAGLAADVPGKPHLKRGIGFGTSFKNVGFSFGAPEQCTAKIELRGSSEIEEAVLYHSAAEVGQGTHSAMRQMAAEALNLPLEKITLVASDTAYTENSGSVSASRMTFMSGNSIRGAAAAALEKWQAEERPAVATYQYRPPRTTPMDPETGKSEPNFAYGYVAETVEVQVDTETGEVEILNVVCADDVGQSINPREVQGQIEGAVVQAAGYSLLENFIERDGQVLTRTLSTYLIPTVLDVPHQVQALALEIPDENGPWGARGMGEMPYLPFAAAVIDAVHSATGVWFDDFPLTPERVLRGLGKL